MFTIAAEYNGNTRLDFVDKQIRQPGGGRVIVARLDFATFVFFRPRFVRSCSSRRLFVLPLPPNVSDHVTDEQRDLSVDTNPNTCATRSRL